MWETWTKEFKISFIKFLIARWLRSKERWPLFALVGRTDYFWAKANAIQLCTITKIRWMKYLISETNISKYIEWRTQIYLYVYSTKQNSIVQLSRYKTSSLNPQSKLNRRKTTSCSKRIFHLTHFAIPTSLPKLIVNSWYGFTSSWESTLAQSLN